MTEDEIFAVIEEHAKDGVDFMTVHCGVTRESLATLKKQGRKTDIVSRGGAFLIGWMLHNDKENPLYQYATFLTNQFLIAMPGMADPNFAQTVTLVCEHNAQGALGIVINRPLPMTFGDVFRQLGLEAAQARVSADPVLQGGPVQTDRGFVLHRPTERSWDSTLEISESLHVTTSRDVLTALAQGRGPEQVVVALGYAGWDAGQLEDEILRNGWLHCPADPSLLFDRDLSSKYTRALRSMGVELERLSATAGHA